MIAASTRLIYKDKTALPCYIKHQQLFPIIHCSRLHMMDTKKFALVVLSLILVFGLAKSFDYHESDLASEESLWDLYERWRSHHTLSRDLKEKQVRFNVFKQNLKQIHKVNQMDKPYKLKLNRFADMTNHEFMSSRSSKINHYRMLHGPRKQTGFMHGKTGDLPPPVDWREKGAVTGIKKPRKLW